MSRSRIVMHNPCSTRVVARAFSYPWEWYPHNIFAAIDRISIVNEELILNQSDTQGSLWN